MSIHDLYAERKNFYLSPSTTLRGALVLCLILGAVTFAAAMHNAPIRAWGSFLFNLFFFFSIALGGIAFASMQDVIGAVWARPIKRIHESFAVFLPVAALLFMVFFACILLKIGSAHEVYRWIKDPEVVHHFFGKRDWLHGSFMVARDVFALIIIVSLSMWQLSKGLHRDQVLIDGNRDEALSLGIKVRQKLQYWSAPILVVYALCFSLLAFDLIMSLAPTWFSTLFAAWMFAIMMQTLFATLLIVMFALRKGPMGRVIRQQQFHDVGKLMHGFTVFFAYLTYAHVLTYWYGNMPEETEYFLHRLHQPWLSIVLVAPLLSFVVPLFGLLPKVSKWTPMLTIPLCLIILFAQWLADLLVVMPEVVAAENFGFPWIEIGTFLGFLALFGLTVTWFAKRYPLLGIADPLLPLALRGDHH